MNISIDIRLDLSPALASVLQELARAFGGRGFSYENSKADSLNLFERQVSAEHSMPVSASAPSQELAREAPVDGIEIATTTAPAAKPEPPVAELQTEHQREADLGEAEWIVGVLYAAGFKPVRMGS